MPIDLDQPITSLQGVGEAVAKKLKKLGIETVEDLINHYPRRYDDFSKITPIAKLKPGQVTVEGQILKAITRRTHRRGFTITEALIDDGTAGVKAVWFNQPYLAKLLPKDVPIYASGKLEFKYNQYALQNPIVEQVSAFTKNTARIVPVYPETEGLTSKQIRNLIQPLLATISKLTERLPKSVIKQAKLLPYDRALTDIHFPLSREALEQAKYRLAFEELFLLVLTGLVIKNEIKTETSPRIKFQADVAKKFVTSLSFKLTNAQRKASWQILKDIDSTTPMNRLLEGDVGSGKTIVAAMAATIAMASDFQVALMAPTEVLANQHFKTLETLSEHSTFLRDRVKKLTSGVKGKPRTAVVNELAQSQPLLVIGTHALLEPDVNFHKLGLVIIDEQHRFGVNQRTVLKQKAAKLPHLLAMSATPIPRSLALTVYGDLDISVIDELPAGRKPVTTQVASDRERDEVYRHIDGQIQQGRQVYVICPLIAESDPSTSLRASQLAEVKSVEAEAQRLKNSIFKHRQIGLLHGRMKAAEKASIMQQLSKGQIDILVSTTVVEVGVDVPNASVMLIEGAERFGLASLHQLRGRVGRAEHQSYCYLLTTNDRQARHRLELLERYYDGFTLAQKDLELRGPGELYGKRQHGLLDLRLANLSDTKLIEQVRTVASKFLHTDDLLKYPDLVARVNKLKGVTTLD